LYAFTQNFYVKRNKTAPVLALAALLLLANLAQAVITPREIAGAQEAALETTGGLAFIGQLAWTIASAALTIIGAGTIIKRLWVDEEMLQRVLLSRYAVMLFIGTATPWIITAIRPEATFAACVLRGWLGFMLNAFC